MTKLNEFLSEAKERAEKATPGPWRNQDDDPMLYGAKSQGKVAKTCEHFMNRTQRNSNTQFIKHAREDVPRLIEIVEALTNKLKLICDTDQRPNVYRLMAEDVLLKANEIAGKK